MGQTLATISIYSIERYLTAIGENSLFANLTLPEGIDKEVVTNNILFESLHFEAMYTDPIFLRDAIKLWGQKYYRTFEKWQTALNIKYDPLYNYDRTEEWEDETKEDTTRKNSTTTTSTGNNTTNHTGENYNTNDHYVTPYDTTDLTRDTQEKDSGKDSYTDKDNYSNTGKGSFDETEGKTGSLKRKGRAYGNIGVTTSQQMLQSELDIAKFNLTKQITDLFLEDFCILVY